MLHAACLSVCLSVCLVRTWQYAPMDWATGKERRIRSCGQGCRSGDNLTNRQVQAHMVCIPTLMEAPGFSTSRSSCTPQARPVFISVSRFLPDETKRTRWFHSTPFSQIITKYSFFLFFLAIFRATPSIYLSSRIEPMSGTLSL
jgi:hypothetical protein